MEDQFSRTRLLIGEAAVEKLGASHIAIFGIGGVGGFVVEVLARSGIGMLDLIDNDRISITNVNRQIIALTSNVGERKVDVAEKRILDINPACKVNKFATFYMPENAGEIDLSVYDYVVDCIDTVTAKLEIIRRCHELNVPVISCMGAAKKMDATAFRVADISDTKMDPLAKVIRKKLRKEGIRHLKVVFSDEMPLKPFAAENLSDSSSDVNANQDNRKTVPASNAFVPAAEGIIAGGEVVKDIIKDVMRK